ncbi:MAG: hypothetical protein KJ749_01490, partial [Planctomycetes bacterium]|nr:hypothetical protein [Planctomycetota bacterium]
CPIQGVDHCTETLAGRGARVGTRASVGHRFRRLTFFNDDGLKRIVVDALRVLQQRFGHDHRLPHLQRRRATRQE